MWNNTHFLTFKETTYIPHFSLFSMCKIKTCNLDMLHPCHIWVYSKLKLICLKPINVNSHKIRLYYGNIYFFQFCLCSLKLNLCWFHVWPGSGSKTMDPTSLQKFKQVKQWYQPEIVVMVYKLSFLHFLAIFNGKMPNFVAKISLKIPKKQQNFA